MAFSIITTALVTLAALLPGPAKGKTASIWYENRFCPGKYTFGPEPTQSCGNTTVWFLENKVNTEVRVTLREAWKNKDTQLSKEQRLLEPNQWQVYEACEGSVFTVYNVSCSRSAVKRYNENCPHYTLLQHFIDFPNNTARRGRVFETEMRYNRVRKELDCSNENVGVNNTTSCYSLFHTLLDKQFSRSNLLDGTLTGDNFDFQYTYNEGHYRIQKATIYTVQAIDCEQFRDESATELKRLRDQTRLKLGRDSTPIRRQTGTYIGLGWRLSLHEKVVVVCILVVVYAATYSSQVSGARTRKQGKKEDSLHSKAGGNNNYEQHRLVNSSSQEEARYWQSLRKGVTVIKWAGLSFLALVFGVEVAMAWLLFFALHLRLDIDLLLPRRQTSALLCAHAVLASTIFSYFGPDCLFWISSIALVFNDYFLQMFSPTLRRLGRNDVRYKRLVKLYDAAQNAIGKIKKPPKDSAMPDPEWALLGAPMDGLYISPGKVSGPTKNSDAVFFTFQSSPSRTVEGCLGWRFNMQHLPDGDFNTGLPGCYIVDGFVSATAYEAFWIERCNCRKEEILYTGKFNPINGFVGEALSASSHGRVSVRLVPLSKTTSRVHYGSYCDNCGIGPIQGTRYSVKEKNFDLCQRCMQRHDELLASGLCNNSDEKTSPPSLPAREEFQELPVPPQNPWEHLRPHDW